MNATIDLDDAEGLLAADRDGSLEAASMAGSQVRAVGTAVAEGALANLRSDDRSRAVVWVAGRGTAATAGAILAGAFSDTVSLPFVTATRAPVWIGPLDVMVVAGDDAGDPALSAAVSVGTRRGARVVIAAPDEGPLADSGAGRAISLAPRLRVPDTFSLAHNLAVGAAVLGVVDRTVAADVMTIADEVDGEVSRNTVGREVFTNAAKAIAARLTGGPAVLCGDRSATLALAEHAASTLLRLTQRTATACGLSQALSAVRDALSGRGSESSSLFHDEFIDGPRGEGPPRILALATAGDFETVAARIEGVDDAELVSTTDLGEVAARPSELAQLMMLATRFEMASVYARLGGGRSGL
ncbi:TobH protein [Mycobacterium sp. CBMA271]|uniref:TobH protein n=1 Tax=unclassified Mycobacteroides TaxID=2618759 RepID=UPI0012DFAF7B|nr:MULTISPECIES: TobH protein [unclassified Mycobacteroides]MUM16466.1 TobH protein [Mycobacteroides sp. CBMA 326]MUM20590.1 TobH protein [Mycobacteroides sp. CBMA 271]